MTLRLAFPVATTTTHVLNFRQFYAGVLQYREELHGSAARWCPQGQVPQLHAAAGVFSSFVLEF